MSPEIIQGRSCGNECDLWALGIIIYIFFAEYPPFKGEYQDETLQKIEEEQIEFPENFPIVAKDLCIKLLDKDPSRRLGCGRSGMINDIEALKSHPFFYGIDFDNLVLCKSPVPVSDVIRSSLKKRIIEKYRKDDSNDINLTFDCGNTSNSSDSSNLKLKSNSVNKFDPSFELSQSDSIIR